MTTTTAPSTFSDAIDAYTDTLLDEILAGADTCRCCGLPLLTAALDTATDTAWVDTDLTAIESLHKRMEVAAVLDHGSAKALKDGLFRVACDSRVRAVSIAAHLERIGVPTNAITIGSS